ncbi:hypothetical protein CFC21_024426 [Triticum aestivum]|uniref:Late embryogenesis abundant protein LEA-2 subgroup domain-containing protein n=2 Tax=Triticum aestivum TaxID=4565 RepID=A0A9R1EGK8_WHEAT|nr:hypothetical protein CFC21_024426 [Triticum aestivum]
MAEQDGDVSVCCCLLATVAFIVILVGVVALIYEHTHDYDRSYSQPPRYSVAITGVAGLDLADVAGDRPTLSPVFNLTLHVNNSGDRDQACVPLLSTASVSYGDAFLGKGSVASFCVEAKGEQEGRARAWGQNVTVPRFLRDQLAGELKRGDAAVDVAVKMPLGCNIAACYDKVLLCKAKIRGGSPCSMTVANVPR